MIFPHLYPVGFENIMNIENYYEKGNLFLSHITSVPVCYKTIGLDWIVTLKHFTCKQLNILLTALYLAVHFTLQFVANAYVKQKKITGRE
jgi:hypothetical protein